MPEKEKNKEEKEKEKELKVGKIDLGKIGDIDSDKLVKLALIKEAIEGGKDIGKYLLLREIMK